MTILVTLPISDGTAARNRSRAQPGTPVCARCSRGVRLVALFATLVFAVVACGSVESGSRAAGAAVGSSTATLSAAPVPPDWKIVALYGLQIPLPSGWEKTIDAVGKSDRAEANAPQILYFEHAPKSGAASALLLSIWIWDGSTLDDLVRTRFVEGNLSFVSQSPLSGVRPMREVIGRAAWSGPQGSGSYRARHLFVQVEPARVVDVITFGAQVPRTDTEPSADMRRIQEIVAHNTYALASASCPRTRSVDEFGVLTSDGVTGVVDRTYASARSVNEFFVLVRRGGAVGQRAAIEFRQLGTSAPATWVAYEVAAEARPTPPGIRPSPWDGAAFKLGVKPIGFGDSCWRLIVDGKDTGIVLQVGP
jgi:hypothetical protein